MSPPPAPGPDFICIGAMKSGTTWLHSNLLSHSRLWLAPVKEISYLNMVHGSEHGLPPTPDRLRAAATSSRAKLLARTSPPTGREARRLACYEDMLREPIDDAWYGRIFSHRSEGEVTGDVTPAYALLPPAGIAHAARMSPNLKVIALLRDPAERAFSHMVMHAAAEPTESRLVSMLRGKRWPLYAFHSDYATWLGRWREVVGRDAIHIDTMDRIRTSPEAVLRDLCAFLDIPLDPGILAKADRPVMAARLDSRGLRGVIPLIRAQLAREYEALARDWPEMAKRFSAGS